MAPLRSLSLTDYLLYLYRNQQSNRAFVVGEFLVSMIVAMATLPHVYTGTYTGTCLRMQDNSAFFVLCTKCTLFADCIWYSSYPCLIQNSW